MTLRGYGLSLCTFALLTFTLACGKKNSSPAVIPSFPPTDPGPPELPYCSTAITYDGSTVTIDGNAVYKYRDIVDDVTGHGLGPIEATGRPIRFAEVRVLNSAGVVAQCAETDVNGDFSFVLPAGSVNYTVQVNSRSKNANLVATVFDLPETKNFYSLTKSVSASISTDLGTFTAPANGTLTGGAFNILDQLLEANDYLRDKVGTGKCSYDGCVEFTVSPKIEVFWTRGFNPGSYFDSGPLSFYLPNYGRLFILGGVNGDTDNSDTDHFDNSVIIHEFGHFLEDKMFVSDSPGGSHNGNKIIDPRLAWSEGWGNFLQAAVQSDPLSPFHGTYIDTVGNVDGNTSFAFYIDLETAISNKDFTSAGHNGADGEGIFREFSVTRLLWDAIDDTDAEEGPPTDDTHLDDVKDSFPDIWASLSKTNGGWKDPDAAFRSAGWLHEVQAALTISGVVSPISWTNIQAIERHVANQSEYGEYLITQAAACATTFNIVPKNILGDSGAISTSDLFRNNDFFHFYNDTARSNVKMKLVYDDDDGSGTIADLDFYVYNSSARFGNSSDIVAMSRKETSGSSTQTEQVTIGSLPKGHYLLNVYVYTGASIGGPANYKIQISAADINGGAWTNLCAGAVP